MTGRLSAAATTSASNGTTPRPQPERAEAASRAEAQRHLDARLERLRAYAAALEAALAAGPSDERLARLQGQLGQVHRDLRAAARPRLPKQAGLPLHAGGGRG